MFSVTTSAPVGFDFAFCEICDNYTPNAFIEEAGESGCQYCWEAYGEIH